MLTANRHSVQPISEELLKRLGEAFRQADIGPGTHMDYIMYNAGQRSVLAWISNYIGDNKVSNVKPST